MWRIVQPVCAGSGWPRASSFEASIVPVEEKVGVDPHGHAFQFLCEQRYYGFPIARPYRREKLCNDTLTRRPRQCESNTGIAYAFTCAMNHLAASRLGLAEHFSHFLVVVVEYVVQQECGPFLGAQALEDREECH